MNLKEGIEKLSKLILEFNEQTPEEVVEQKFVEASLADGTVVNVEPALEIGASVTVLVDGEFVPAPDGVHELADGSRLATEGGVIVDLAPAEEEVEEEPAEMETQEKREAKKVIESTVKESVFSAEEKETLENDVKELKAKVDELTTKFETVKTENDKLKEVATEQFSIIEKLAEVPAEEPKQKPNSPFRKKEDFSRREKLIEILKKK